MHYSAATALALAVVALLLAPEARGMVPETLRFEVRERARDCLFKEIRAKMSVDAQVVVVKGGKLDIGFSITTPDESKIFDSVIFSNIDDRTGRVLPQVVNKGHRFRAAATGKYTFCFDNAMSQWTPKQVHFQLTQVDEEADAEAKAEAAAADKLDAAEERAGGAASGKVTDPSKPVTLRRMTRSVERMAETMDKAVVAQEYARVREEMHRNTAEDSNARVVWFTLLESFVIVFVSAYQAFTIKGWFANTDAKERARQGRAQYGV